MSDPLPQDLTAPASLAQAIVRGAPEAIIVADPDGAIRLWNDGADRMFGYPSGEALGQTLDLIVPEKHRRRHWEGYNRVMRTGVTRYADSLLSVPATHSSGRRVFVLFSVTFSGTTPGGSSASRRSCAT